MQLFIIQILSPHIKVFSSIITIYFPPFVGYWIWSTAIHRVGIHIAYLDIFILIRNDFIVWDMIPFWNAMRLWIKHHPLIYLCMVLWYLRKVLQNSRKFGRALMSLNFFKQWNFSTYPVYDLQVFWSAVSKGFILDTPPDMRRLGQFRWFEWGIDQTMHSSQRVETWGL